LNRRTAAATHSQSADNQHPDLLLNKMLLLLLLLPLTQGKAGPRR
jgi:hypothetical protein